ncbi:HTH-type transcriptional activator CmpR [Clostridium liquoris]|jgi:DNA-binding transcriptional LysR family regulator|uniref:HTH-type transcriptional activator CmpR n=1 Tax=Clostridium liquoris TaxID=1289519 RepID=A0A2T0B6W2_9CLOT|nr:selenium metabolism-associated LysR family transcriptional regulator [Clostridium liquoris]PRR79553.1 HTH-type transcriptional activator CmpR [Clostridium liquoris]
MNERKLRIFYEVAIKLNMTTVAESMYISQPAVSQTIQELEKELNVRLFDRIGKKLHLTYEGEIFLQYVRRILNIYDEGINRIKDINNLAEGKIKIGASTTIGIYVLPDIIGKFMKKYKNVDISIAIENTKIIADMILENKIDFAFVEGPVYEEDIMVEDFCEDELVIITSKEHNWAELQGINLDKIAESRIIMREKGSGTREVFENMLNSKGISYKIAFELGNTEAIKKAVEAGLGISCISKRCVKDEILDGRIAAIKLIDEKIKRKFSLIYHRDKFMSKLFQSFIDFARNQVDNI